MSAEEIIDFGALEPEIQSLIEKSIAAREYSYSPYSKFKVGAAILCDDGSIFAGCNIENSSYPAGMCAERVAMGKAISEGKRAFKALAVTATGGNTDFVTPCGICRQFAMEFGDLAIYLSGVEAKRILRIMLSNLLPHAFHF